MTSTSELYASSPRLSVEVAGENELGESLLGTLVDAAALLPSTARGAKSEALWEGRMGLRVVTGTLTVGHFRSRSILWTKKESLCYSKVTKSEIYISGVGRSLRVYELC